MRVTAALLVLAAVGRPALAQSDEQLRAHFEGKTVVVKIDMPGTESGVDVHPGRAQPIVFPDLAKRLKQYGTAVHPGDQVLVTKVKVKKDLIEFQLGGGGYGTFGDGCAQVPRHQRRPPRRKQSGSETWNASSRGRPTPGNAGAFATRSIG